ncbi:MAG: hypothetical protein ACJ718_06600 [Nitrososphaeraceae archaeon]
MSENISEAILYEFHIINLQGHMQGVMSLSIILLLIASLATMAVVLNPAFAGSRLLFKNKSECIEYVIDGTSIVRNHALQKAKVSKELAEKLCAEY